MKSLRDFLLQAKRFFVLGAHIQRNCLVERHGSDYGGWTICPTTLSKKSIVYSFGVGEEISFDLSLIAHFGLSVFAFDPTPKSIRWAHAQKFPSEFNFFEYGLAAYDGQATFYPPDNQEYVSYSVLKHAGSVPEGVVSPVFRLTSIMEKLGHRYVDVVKMDVEGAEYDVIVDLAASQLAVAQLVVEFHHRFVPDGLRRTKRSIQLLNRAGFKIFYISPSGNEISFINSRY